MPQQEMLVNQVLEEILRERTSSFLIRKKSRDFWLIPAPRFIYSSSFLTKLEQTNFYNKKKNKINEFLNEKSFSFYSVLLSTDESFINWIKLRLGYFENLSKPDKSDQNINCDGIFDSFNISKNSFSPLDFYLDYISPEIKRKKHDKIIELYYTNMVDNLSTNSTN
jgi:hypothetical protein